MTSGWEITASYPQSVHVTTSTNRMSRFEFREVESGRPTFFYLVHHSHYTQELIDDCRSRLHCFHCGRAIVGRVRFFPLEFTKQDVPVMDQLPHCRPECAKATCSLRANNMNLISCFHLMYGPNVQCAPPREILYLPNGVSMQRFHEMIDEHLVMDLQQDTNVKAMMAPVYLSGCIFNNNVIPLEAQSALKSMIHEPPAILTHSTQSMERDNSSAVVELPMHADFSTIAATFTVDEESNTDFT